MPIQDNEAVILDSGKLRKTIRKKVVEILLNKTDANEKVFPNATIPPWVEELPVILIYPKSEPASEFNVAPRELARDLDLTIEIIATGPEENSEAQTPASGGKSLEDIIDDIAEQIECEMSKDETLGGTADDSILTGTDFDFEGGGGQPIGAARLTYSVTYYTMSPRAVDKAGPLDDFDTAKVEFNIDGDEIDTEDTIDLS